ncbi:MAG: hypothetical protein DWQ44_07115 [Bacteroidetes bacterium]|nr:MAG: hypothetical protein DWQ33_12575 [Bacteroidota bacterium]REJ99786.1 MAG: hypothetical protein DWQ39_12735 [Bacteroidota bacterium]REK34159.1 MAG: hypothetical protein DWQ44_07115 [Bacteroidota bacterium]REK50489.1 MAG: hypothetical protein DWQ48_04025 [Bacteroidota bacterium]
MPTVSFYLMYLLGFQNLSDSTVHKNYKTRLIKLEEKQIQVQNHQIDFGSSFFYDRNSAIKKSLYIKSFFNYSREAKIEYSVKTKIQYNLDYRFAATYFIDSLWNKNRDEFNISLMLLNKKSAKIHSSYSLQINSGIFPEFGNSVSSSDYSSFFNPGSILFTRGFMFKFWKRSWLNVSLASIRIWTLPVLHESIPDKINKQAEPERKWNFDYGFSLKCGVREKLTNKLEWDARLTLFINSATAYSQSLLVDQRLTYSPFKPVRITSHSSFRLNPARNRQAQFFQEIQIGIGFVLIPDRTQSSLPGASY